MEQFRQFNKIYTDEQELCVRGEFQRFKDETYLDHVGATLYSEKQLQNIFSELSSNIFANPHARNLSSKLTEDAIDIVRFQILNYFNTTSEEYSVIFTSGATRSLQIVAECFDYGNDIGTLCYLENNHTSVLGMRNYAKKCKEIKVKDAFNNLNESTSKTPNNTKQQSDSNSLFVYPAQSNFCGTKFPLDWIEKVKNGKLSKMCDINSKNWFVVLDAASFVPTNNLDLSKYKPDFVPISFYKIFGYPTGLGALLVRKTSEHVVHKKYLGGGTVLMALSSQNVMIPRPVIYERFEDGTLPFLSIVAVKHGFETIRRLKLTLEDISKHTFSLAQYVYRNLLTLHHANGNPVSILYHDTVFEDVRHQGSIVNFNLLRANGEYIGYSEVLHMSNLHGIHLRTGCFCNPGACQKYLCLTSEDVKRHFDAGHICGDQHDLVDNYPTGSVRISFGYMSTKKDADNFLAMIKDCFVTAPSIEKLPNNFSSIQKQYRDMFNITNQNDIIHSDCSDCINNNTIEDIETLSHHKLNGSTKTNCNENDYGILEQIFLYPIKSCGAFAVSKSWKLIHTGLQYDRQWMIINSSGVCVTQKQNRRLCLIKPVIDFENNKMVLNFNKKSCEILLNENDPKKSIVFPCQSKVCGDRIQGWDCGNEVSNWLSDVLETPGLRLLKQCDDDGRFSRKVGTVQLSLANKAKYLLVNQSSVQWLRNKIEDESFKESLEDTIHRFRPNLIVNFKTPFVENECKEFVFDNLTFTSKGNCTRCQMICIDQSTGQSSKEPLLTLSREFKGKISFGVYLNLEDVGSNCEICIGSKVKATK